MIDLWIAIGFHFIGDFPFQGEWIANNKGKSWEIMFYHCAVYVSLFAIMGALPIQLLILFVSHFVIDNLKARYHLIRKIWQDQILHLIVIYLLFN